MQLGIMDRTPLARLPVSTPSPLPFPPSSVSDNANHTASTQSSSSPSAPRLNSSRKLPPAPLPSRAPRVGAREQALRQSPRLPPARRRRGRTCAGSGACRFWACWLLLGPFRLPTRAACRSRRSGGTLADPWSYSRNVQRATGGGC